MLPSVRLSLCLAAALLVQPAFTAPANPPANDNSAPLGERPVAYLYVSDGNSHVLGFAVAKSGKLTPVPGSPFYFDIWDMAVSKKYLFATGYFSTKIDTYIIAHDGSLRFLRTTDAGAHNPGGCGAVGSLTLDRTRATLYAGTLDSTCFDGQYQAYRVHFPTGRLHYLDTTPGFGLAGAGPLTFMRNNRYAYQAACTIFDHEEVGFLQGVERHSYGTLSMLNLGPLPPAPEPQNEFCPLDVSIARNYLLATMEDEDSLGDPFGTYLAKFRVDANGNLTITGTPTKMIDGETSISTSPSGQFVSVTGSAGILVYKFHGSDPMTLYASLLPSLPSDTYLGGASWLDDNHLLVVESRSQGKPRLHVFTLIEDDWHEAPGSPYTFDNAVALGVHPNHVDRDNDFDGD